MLDQQYEDTPRLFTFWQRALIGLAAYLGYALTYVIGRTLRWTVKGSEHWQALEGQDVPVILSFWHTCIFPAIWFLRRRGIIVMTSQNFDGEYIARIIEKHGFLAARGSSSRGGMRALRAMEDGMARGHIVAFAIDGPRGPRYVAKIGPVLLAQRTGRPIICFHISLQHKIQLRSWDQFKIPLPFTRAFIQLSPPIYIPREARRAQILATHAEMQRALDRLREEGDQFWQQPQKKRMKDESGGI